AALGPVRAGRGPIQGECATVRTPISVCAGEGVQSLGLPPGLLDSSPVFAARMAMCPAALAPHTDWSLLAVVRGETAAPPADRADVGQPLLWAVSVSLAAVWQAYGIRPAAVIGHSRGEIAAACVAGVLSLADAAAVIAARGQLLAGAGIAGAGAMVAVALGEDAARARLTGDLEIAAVNGPDAVVVAGDPAEVDAYAARCAEDGTRTRTVTREYA